MKKKYVAAALWALGIFGGLRSAPAESTANLLVNPGAESGTLTGWTLTGDATAHVDDGSFNPGISPETGTRDFVGGTGASATLTQVVNIGAAVPVPQLINPAQAVVFWGFFQQSLSAASPDTSGVQLTFLDAGMNVLGTADSGSLAEVGTWLNYLSGSPPYPGTVFVRYQMIFTRHTGNDLDAYIDGNSLAMNYDGTTFTDGLGTHVWGSSGNWRSGLPGSNTTAILVSPVLKTVNLDTSIAPSQQLPGLYIDGAAGVTLTEATTDMYSTEEVVGNLANGTYTQTGGANHFTRLSVGYFAGGNGTYNASFGSISGGSIYVGGSASGAGGAGVFNISGEDIFLSDVFRVWNTPGTAVNLSAGLLSVGSLDTQGNPSRFHWTGGAVGFGSAITIDNNFALGPVVSLNSTQEILTNGALTNNGTIMLAGGELLAFASCINNGSYSGTGNARFWMGMTNYGFFSIAGGYLESRGDVVNNGTFIVSAPQFWTAGQTFTNNAGSATFASGIGAASGMPVNVVVNGGVVIFSAPQNLPLLNIQRGQVALVSGTTKTASLIFGGSGGSITGLLDLQQNKLVVEPSVKADGLAALRAEVLYGKTHAGGIVSSTMAGSQVIAVVDNALLGLTSFGGQAADAGSLLVMATFPGDANLDGKVDITDLNMLAGHWQQAAQDWSQGNFNGDAKVDITDLNMLAGDWQFGLVLAGERDGFVTAPEAAPEPGALAIVALGAAALTRRCKGRILKS